MGIRFLVFVGLLLSGVLGNAKELPPELMARCELRFQELAADQEAQNRFVTQIAKDLHIEEGAGISLLDTSRWFNPQDYEEIFKALPKELMLQVFTKKGEPINSKTHKNDIPHDFLNHVSDYALWLLKVLNESLSPTEQLEIDYVQIRTHEKGVWSPAFLAGQKPHNDQNYLTATLALVGSGTVFQVPGADIRDPNAKIFHEVAQGQTLIITADQRVDAFPKTRSTWHHAPLESQDRLLILVRFKPRKT
jgi:hypothetical protein